MFIKFAFASFLLLSSSSATSVDWVMLSAVLAVPTEACHRSSWERRYVACASSCSISSLVDATLLGEKEDVVKLLSGKLLDAAVLVHIGNQSVFSNLFSPLAAQVSLDNALLSADV